MVIAEGIGYTKEHEWVKEEDGSAYIGITDFAQHNLGDIVFVGLPEPDTELNKGDVLSAVDSVKAASDIYTPVSGKVIEVNEALADSPEDMNNDPYESWIAKLELSDKAELNELMNADEYKAFCDKGGVDAAIHTEHAAAAA